MTTQKQEHKHEEGSEELSTLQVMEVTHQQLPKAKRTSKVHF